MTASANASGVIVFAASSSLVEIGVASSGSSVRDVFSPITACAASAIDPTIGTSRRRRPNWWKR